MRISVPPPAATPGTFSNEDIQRALLEIWKLPIAEQREFLTLLERLEEAEAREKARIDFLTFVKKVWPGFIEGRHHLVMAAAFERVMKGELKRLIICMPPRFSKSELSSYLLPAWFLGHNPGKKVIQASHTAELSVGFGRKVRNLVASGVYRDVFPGLQLRADSKAAGRWSTNQGGEYFAIGVGGAVTGKGADLFIVDDPHSEQQGVEGAMRPEIFDKVYDWYTSGPRQRLQPQAAILVICTRWHQKDLVGRLIKASTEREGVDEWEMINLPAIMPTGESMWPEFWPTKELLKTKAEIPAGKWSAQYQQDPTAEEGALLKREWWNVWEKERAPDCTYIIQTWDTAHTKTSHSNYSACTTWGVFERKVSDDKTVNNIILLDSFKERMEFPDLKEKVLELWKYWKPDTLLMENRGSGISLIQELRRMGVPVADFTPSRGSKFAPNDKVARVNAVTDIFRSEMVWAPQQRYAEEVIEECVAFPMGDADDLVDCTTMAIQRFRDGQFIKLPSDEEEVERVYRPHEPYY